MMLAICLVFAIVLTPVGHAQTESTLRDRFELVYLVLEFIETRALGSASATELIRGALRGMVSAMEDPYSQYLDPDAFSALMQRLEGVFSGVGVVVTSRDGFITVVSPIRGTPGERAGLQPHDRIISIDGTDVVGRATEEAVLMMRGPEGTPVTLTVLRPSTGGTFTVTITRAPIEVPTVEARLIEPGIGYIMVTSFNDHTAAQFETEFRALTAAGISGLIIDLRNNGGGIVERGVAIADPFVPEGPVVYIVDRMGNRRTLSSQTPAWDRPLVVLVNEGTASTAEILAGSIQDWNTGIILGTTTFGKGTVQTVFSLPGHGGLRLTTAEYLTPIGRSVRDSGIVPDIEVTAADSVRLRPDRILTAGHSGPDVAQLQTYLAELGYDVGAADGMFGPRTERAVRDLQTAAGLSLTGRVDAAEVDVINRTLPVIDVQLEAAIETLRQRIGL